MIGAGSTLVRLHPVQLVLGGILVMEEMATKGGQLSFAVLCEQAAEWATCTRDLLLELAHDGERHRMMQRELLGDGEASEADRRQLDASIVEMITEALTGRIIR